MTGLLAIARVTLRQLLGGKRMIVFALLALLPAVVMWFSTGGLTARAVAERFHEAAVGTLFLAVVPIVALVFGASTLGDERRDHTLSFLLLRPRPRWTVAAAKLAAAWLATAVLVVPSAALAAGVVAVRSGDTGLIGPAMLAVALSALAYTAVFLVIGFLTGRAVLLGLVYVFVWENGITFGAPALANISLFRIGLSAHAGLVPDSAPILADALGSVTPGAGGAIAKAFVIAAACIAITGAMLRRRDLL